MKTMTTLSPPNIMPSHLLNIYEFKVDKLNIKRDLSHIKSQCLELLFLTMKFLKNYMVLSKVGVGRSLHLGRLKET